MFKQLIVPYDFSETANQALQWALVLGEQFSAKIQAFIIPDQALLSDSLLNAEAPSWDELLAKVDEHCQSWAQQFSVSEATLDRLDLEILEADSLHLLVEKSEKIQADLIITSTHGRTGLQHLLLGSQTEDLVRKSPLPVLVVRGKPQWPFKKALLPIAFSEYPEESLKLAQSIHSHNPTQFQLFHVVSLADLPTLGVQLPNYAGAHLEQDLMKQAKENLQKLQKQFSELPTEVSVALGSPAPEINRHAQEGHFDLIILPTHGRKGLDHWLIGSTAEQVIRYAHCCVLTFCPLKTAKS